MLTTYGDLISELTYRCYAFNRCESPDVTPAQWATIFDHVPEMEARFQREQGGAA